MSIFSRDKNNDIVVYALHDSAAASHAMPLFFASEGLAIRALTDAVNGGNKEISSHPACYTLHRIGTYDPVAGIIKGHSPELVITAAQLLAQK